MSSDTPSPDSLPPTEAIEAAAAAWLSLRDGGMSPDETASFLRWLQQDPRHAEIFAELDRTWASFDRLAVIGQTTEGGGRTPDADILAPRARARRPRVLAWASLGIAATIAAFVAVTPRHTAETEVGAFRKIDLPDGSVVQLNTDSAIDTNFTATERRIRIARGEAFFSVAKDAARPFIVSSGPIAVRAVGTAFNVRQHADVVEVLVTEGQVQVNDTRDGRSALPAPTAMPQVAATAPLLVAGERALVLLAERPSSTTPASAIVEPVAPLALKRALAWQERRLEFDTVPLAQVAREFNRYNRQQLVIADAALAARKFSGSFRADGYESFVRLLETDFGVSVTHEGRETVLRARP
jgi:transmembrane sensor